MNMQPLRMGGVDLGNCCGRISHHGSKRADSQLKFVFVSACDSRNAGDALIAAGVDHVICCKEKDQMLSNAAASVFARHFYRALALGNTVKVSFELGKEGVKNDGVDNAQVEMNKFVLLPEQGNHDVKVFESASSGQRRGQRERCARSGIPYVPRLVGRDVDAYQVLQKLVHSRLVRVTGPPGIGKGSLAQTVGHYLDERKTWGDVFWLDVIEDSNCNALYMQLYRDLARRSQDLPLSLETPAEEETRDRVLTDLDEEKAVIIIDAKKASDETTRALGSFLYDLFKYTKHVKVVAVHRQGVPICSPNPSGYSWFEQDMALEPLGFEDTVLVFAEKYQHVSRTSNAMWELVGKLRPRSSPEMFKLLGEGIPSRIHMAATNMTLEEYKQLTNKDYQVNLNDFGKCYKLQLEYGKKIVDVYFALQIPSTLLDNLSSRPKHLADIRRIEKNIKTSKTEELKMVRENLNSIYLTDAKRKDVENTFHSSTVRLFVWCAMGVDEVEENDEELNIDVLRNAFKSKQPPDVALVCMPYGARLVAKKLHEELGVGKVIWIRTDPYIKDLFNLVSSVLLPFCAKIFSGDGRFENSIENLRKNARKLDPCCECGIDANSTEMPYYCHEESSVKKGMPDVVLKAHACCTVDWFKSRPLKKLKLDYADVSLLDDVIDYVVRHGKEEECRSYLLKSYFDARTQKETWHRARAVALYVCNEVAGDDTIFDSGVHRVTSETDALKVQTLIKDKETSGRALIWVDLVDNKKSPHDSSAAKAQEWINGWIDGFSEEMTLVLLFTCGASCFEKVESLVAHLEFEWDYGELKVPTGLEISAGQLNGMLCILPYEEKAEGAKKSLLEIINSPSVLRDALARYVGDEECFGRCQRYNQINIFRDDDSSTKVRVSVSSLAHLKRLLDVVYVDKRAERLAEDLSLDIGKVRFDCSAFAACYERIILQLETLTEHQLEKLAECDDLKQVRIEGGAGTGKTFLALNSTLDYLRVDQERKQSKCVLFVCRNASLAFHFAKWLCHRFVQEGVTNSFLSRIFFLTDDMEKPAGFEYQMGTLTEASRPSKQPLDFGKIVVDEAHDVFRKTQDEGKKYIPREGDKTNTKSSRL